MNTLAGWGGAPRSVATVVRPTSEAEVEALLDGAATGAIPRGLGRAYGDAAQLAGGTVIDARGLDWVGEVGDDATVRVGAGASLDAVLAAVMPKGYFVMVTPGTRQVTVGGAIAADVHGKNHHVDGTFCAHVTSMRLVTPTGTLDVSHERDVDVFWGTAGAMGLTGVVTSATLRLLAIETDKVLVDTDRFGDLDSVMAAMVAGDAAYRYSVAWVDCMARGRHLGRAVLTRGDHARASDLGGAVATIRPPRPARLRVPVRAPSGLLNRATVTAFNEAWFRRAPRHAVAEPVAVGSFFHPLDSIADWNLLYGRRGFVQHQFVVPDAAADTVRRVIELVSDSGVPSFLGVLKRFGPSDPGPLSFPLAGWTLALDFPVGPRALPEILDRVDDLVEEAGGRVYLAKDARLDPRHLATMYPRVGELAALRARLDPRGVLKSDLSRRLGV